MTAVADWSELFAALTLFLVSHAVPSRPRIRAGLIGLVGRRAYLVGYSTISILILGWLIAAAASAPHLELWPREEWQTIFPSAGMFAAAILAVFGLTTPNPLSIVPPSKARFDPERPGVVGFVRHPILWATLLWSGTHIVPNGDLSHVTVFGVFALLSIGGRALLDRRKRRTLGEDTWRILARKTSNWPLASLGKGWRPVFDPAFALRLAGGVLVYSTLVATHGLFAGVPLV